MEASPACAVPVLTVKGMTTPPAGTVPLTTLAVNCATAFIVPSFTELASRVKASATPMASTMLKSARLSTPVAPPPSPVPEFAFSVPRPIATDSADSASLSTVAVTVRSTSFADGPLKVTVAVAVPRLAHVTPVGSIEVEGQETENCARFASPPNVTGTGSVSPATSSRFSRTENSRLEPSGRFTATPSRVTVVASLSLTATDADDAVPTV